MYCGLSIYLIDNKKAEIITAFLFYLIPACIHDMRIKKTCTAHRLWIAQNLIEKPKCHLRFLIAIH
ncbi:MAG: hypothetical protein E6953_00505, partial [Veillonella sp.]|nr:hypothetical protein [Veillonella sp.]